MNSYLFFNVRTFRMNISDSMCNYLYTVLSSLYLHLDVSSIIGNVYTNTEFISHKADCFSCSCKFYLTILTFYTIGNLYISLSLYLTNLPFFTQLQVFIQQFRLCLQAFISQFRRFIELGICVNHFSEFSENFFAELQIYVS